MDTLRSYLDQIVVPTFEDYKSNSGSQRHTYIMAVVIYHAIDRASQRAGKPGNLGKAWRKKCPAFMWIDIIAHHMKHVESSDEKNPRGLPGLPVAYALGLGDKREMDYRNIFFLMREAVTFLHSEADAIDSEGSDARLREERMKSSKCP